MRAGIPYIIIGDGCTCSREGGEIGGAEGRAEGVRAVSPEKERQTFELSFPAISDLLERAEDRLCHGVVAAGAAEKLAESVVLRARSGAAARWPRRRLLRP